MSNSHPSIPTNSSVQPSVWLRIARRTAVALKWGSMVHLLVTGKSSFFLVMNVIVWTDAVIMYAILQKLYDFDWRVFVSGHYFKGLTWQQARLLVQNQVSPFARPPRQQRSSKDPAATRAERQRETEALRQAELTALSHEADDIGIPHTIYKPILALGAKKMRSFLEDVRAKVAIEAKARQLGVLPRVLPLLNLADRGWRSQAETLMARCHKLMEEAERLGIADAVRIELSAGRDQAATILIDQAENRQRRARDVERLRARISQLKLGDRVALLGELDRIAALSDREFTRAFRPFERRLDELDRGGSP